jgi:hypothetical protein
MATASDSPFPQLPTRPHPTHTPSAPVADHFIHIIPAQKASTAAAAGPDNLHFADVVTVPASQVKAGDYIWHIPGWDQGSRGNPTSSSPKALLVHEASLRYSRGLFNPYTMDGSIVVNGLAASAHSSVAALDAVFGKAAGVGLYQAAFGPLRMLYRLMPDVYRNIDQLYSRSGWEGVGMAAIMGHVAQQLVAAHSA